MRRTRWRVLRGFTLLEVVVALAIGMMAILMAAAMLHTTARQTELVVQRAGTIDVAGAGELRLRRLIGQMTWSLRAEPVPVFSWEGMRFATWCDVPAGWLERCTAEVLLPSANASGGMAIRLSTGENLLLLDQEPLMGFLYLVRTERGGAWVDRWTDGSSLPAAVGVVTRTDTLIIRVGERG